MGLNFLPKIAIMREIQSGGLGMEIIRCTEREFKEELLKPN